MRKIIVDEKGNNKKLITYLSSKFNKLPNSAIHKALRNKDIKINSVRVKENVLLKEGDEIEVYIVDDILYGRVKDFEVEKKRIIYEDDNMLIYNKPENIEVQGTKGEQGLEEAIKNHFNYSYFEACHRLDRNTKGLVIFAKNEEARNELVELINNKGIRKFYLALVYGIPKNQKATLKDYLFKDSKNSNVIISSEKKKGYQEIITKYSVVETYKDNTSLLEVELLTGRTHQIRAHLAFIGHPIIGDGKYGINKINKEYGKTTQELCAYKLIFGEIEGLLSYMTKKEFHISKK